MEFVVEPWHWFVLGILLILSELILPAFAALWFGIAAIMVCFLYWLFPDISLTTQIVLWIVLSVLCTLLWFKFIKPLSIDKTKSRFTSRSDDWANWYGDSDRTCS